MNDNYRLTEAVGAGCLSLFVAGIFTAAAFDGCRTANNESLATVCNNAQEIYMVARQQAAEEIMELPLEDPQRMVEGRNLEELLAKSDPLYSTLEKAPTCERKTLSKLQKATQDMQELASDIHTYRTGQRDL